MKNHKINIENHKYVVVELYVLTVVHAYCLQ